ncbi:hypothetical protein ABKV19_021223 [Rosa sericea]
MSSNIVVCLALLIEEDKRENELSFSFTSLAIRVRLTLFSSFAFLHSLKFRRNQKVNSVFAIQRKKENPIPNNSDRLLQLTRWWKRFCWHGVIERGRRGIEIGGVGKFEGLIRKQRGY